MASKDLHADGAGSVVVGRDNAGTINVHVFTGRFASLRSALPSMEAVLAPLRLADFQGRSNLLGEVLDFVDSQPRGWVLIEADAGLGKTALAAYLATRLAQRLTRRAAVDAIVPAHFSGSGNDRSTALRALSAQLIAGYRLDDLAEQGGLPNDANQPHFVTKALYAAAARARASDERLVVVLDGLDEIADHSPGPPLALPGHLPEDTFVVVTYRTGTPVFVPYPALKCRIAVADADNLSDARAYLRHIAARLTAHLDDAGVSADKFTETVLGRSNGLWVYLRQICAGLEEGRLTIGDIDTLPTELSDYYAQSLTTPLADPAGSAVLATLAVAREPLTSKQIAAYARTPAAVVDELCEGRLKPFLTGTPDDGWRLYHQTLVDFLTGTPAGPSTNGRVVDSRRVGEALAAHRRIVDHYMAAFRELPDDLTLADHYARHHLAEHLEAAGDRQQLKSLVSLPAWRNAHQACRSTSRYLDDLDRLRRLAAAATDASVRAGEHAPTVADEIWAAQTMSMAARALDDVPPVLIARLVDTGRWSAADGLHRAAGLRDAAERLHALGLLYPDLPEPLRRDAEVTAVAAASVLGPHGVPERVRQVWSGNAQGGAAEKVLAAAGGIWRPSSWEPGTVAEAVAEPYRGSAVVTAVGLVAAKLSAEDRAVVAAECAAGIRALRDLDTRATATVALLAWGSGAAVTRLASAVLDECTADDDHMLDNRLERLVAHLPSEIADQALDRLRALPDSRGLALVRHLASHLSEAALRGVLADIRGSGRSRSAQLLEDLIPHLPAALLANVLQMCDDLERSSLSAVLLALARHPDVLPYADDVARRADGAYRSPEILAQLSVRLSGPDRLTRAREALAAARGRRDTVATIAPLLPNDLMDEALSATTRPTAGWDCVDAALALTLHLPPRVRGGLALQIFREWFGRRSRLDQVPLARAAAAAADKDGLAEIAATARTVDDPYFRALVLTAVARHAERDLREPLIAAVLDDCLACPPLCQPLARLAPLLDEGRRSAVVHNAFERWRTDGPAAVEDLAALAPLLTGEARSTAVHLLRDVATADLTNKRPYSHSLSVAAKALRDCRATDVLDDVVAAVAAMPANWHRAAAVTALASAVDTRQADRLRNLLVSDERNDLQALAALVPRLSPTALAQLADHANGWPAGPADDLVRLRSAVLCAAARHDGSTVNPDAFARILGTADPVIRPELLAAAVPLLPRLALERPDAWCLPEPAHSELGTSLFVRNMGMLAATVHQRLGSRPGQAALFLLRRATDMARRASVEPAITECSAIIAAHCDDRALESLARTLAAE